MSRDPAASTATKTITDSLTRKQLALMTALFNQDKSTNPPQDHDLVSLEKTLAHHPSEHSLRFSLRALENRELVESRYEIRRDRQCRLVKLTQKGVQLIRSDNDPRWVVPDEVEPLEDFLAML